MSDEPTAPLPEPSAWTVRADDGWELSVLDFHPSREPWACVLLGHAMMVDRRTLCRPDRETLAARLCHAGIRVFAADARGHGSSGPLAHEGGRWGYDELVDDTGPLVDHVRRIAPDTPLVLMGHSLFGHTSLAWLGMHPDAPVDAIVHFGSTVWAPDLEPHPIKWWAKSALLRGTAALASLLGNAPVRRIGLGNMDEPSAYWNDYIGMSRRGCWSRRDGLPYAEGLSALDLPALIISSAADRHFGNPREIDAFTAPLGAKRELLPLGSLDDDDPLHDLVPDHMGMITDTLSRPLWDHVGGWLEERFRSDLSPPSKDAKPMTALPTESS